MKEFLNVAAGVIWKDDCILIAKRRPGGPAGGKWEFPGGKMENNELAADCLRRELLEELSIEVKVGKFLGAFEHSYPGLSIRLHTYEGLHTLGTVHLKVHEAVEWVVPEKLMDFDLADADLPIARLFTSRLMEPQANNGTLQSTPLPMPR